jgi:putative transcriptional regulator
MADSLAGKLLVASLSLTDANFFRTVVLMCMHDEDGALGLVLNRPLENEPVEDHLPQFAPLAANPRVVFQGGPVQTGSALVLGRHHDWVITPTTNAVVRRTALLDLAQPFEEVGPTLAEVRVFAGYAGWTAGQLESELEQEAWFVVDPLERDLFTSEPDELWRNVLRRQPGKLAMFAFAPADPSVN